MGRALDFSTNQSERRGHMFATHIVKNAEEETVGYLVDNVFYTDY